MSEVFSPYACLRSIPYVEPLDDGQIHALAGQSVRCEYAAQQVIFLKDAPSPGIFMVESGYIKLYMLSADGDEYILHLIGPGESFNEIPCFDGGPTPVNAAALSPCVLWMVPPGALGRAIEQNHTLALHVIGMLSTRVRLLVSRIEDLALYSVTTRLARYLLENDGQSGADSSITRVTLAAHLATTPETVSRSLRVLSDAGAITFDRQQITIVKANALRAIAHP